MCLFGFQKLPYFGTYQSIREEKISELKKQTDLLAEELKPPPGIYFEPAKPVPAIKDVIGRALPMIGAYMRLDNKQQVVALIDDVSKYNTLKLLLLLTILYNYLVRGFSNNVGNI